MSRGEEAVMPRAERCDRDIGIAIKQTAHTVQYRGIDPKGTVQPLFLKCVHVDTLFVQSTPNVITVFFLFI